MKRFFKAIGGHIRRRNYYYVCTFITLGILALGIFYFPNAVGRLVESCRDFGNAVSYAFCDFFDIQRDVDVTVNYLPDYAFLNVKVWFLRMIGKTSDESLSVPSTFLPMEWETFKIVWSLYWDLLLDEVNFLSYLYYLASALDWTILSIMFLPILFVILKKLFVRYYFREKRRKENDPQEMPVTDSKPLRGWHWFYFTVISRIWWWFVGLFHFIKQREDLWQIWLFFACLYLNVFTILMEFISYYVYFAFSLDFFNLYRQVYKLFLDLYAIFTFIPATSWIIFVVLLWVKKANELSYFYEVTSGEK